MAKLRIIEIRPEIRANVEASNGYCPCAIWQTPDTKCMCKDFREQDQPGECQCGRFKKVVDEFEPGTIIRSNVSGELFKVVTAENNLVKLESLKTGKRHTYGLKAFEYFDITILGRREEDG